MIDYIGCISREDASVLRELAETSQRILEFGAGASTQIFAAYGQGTVDCVETDPEWIDKTKRNLSALRISKPVTFHSYARLQPKSYDLILIDGCDELRLPFALLTWPALEVGGVMAFHDTRRTKPHGKSNTSDVQNVCWMIERFSPEIAAVWLNDRDSNTTTILKRAPLPYVDWQKTEGRTDAQMGLT